MCNNNLLEKYFPYFTKASNEDLKENNGNKIIKVCIVIDENSNVVDIYVIEIINGQLCSRDFLAIYKYLEIMELKNKKFTNNEEIVLYEQGAWGNNEWLIWFMDEENKNKEYGE